MRRMIFRLLSRGRLSILAFHAVPRDSHPLRPDELALADFEQRLFDMKRYMSFMPLSEAVVRLRAGTLPAGAAAITLDDGYAGWMSGVVPALDRLGLTATLFITTGQLDGRALWNERLQLAIAAAGPTTAPLVLPQDDGGGPMPLATLAQRQAAVSRLDRLLKYQQPDTKEALLRWVEQHCQTDSTAPGRVPAVLSSLDVRQLHARGFEVGAHTVSHPILAQCDDRQAEDEIARSREELSSLIGVPVAGFAYPNGRPGVDFGPQHVRMVQRAGYRYAVSTAWGAATSDSQVFALPRFTPWGPGPMRSFVQMTRNLRHVQPSMPAADDMRRKALLVAFHFPPQAGSSGMLRTLNFAKYLPGDGWGAAVLTATPAAYERSSLDLVAEIPPACGLLRAPALDAARHLAIRGKYWGPMAWPDRWVSWWPGAVLKGCAAVYAARTSPTPYGVVWSTYPITTAHLIGGAIAKWTGLPWVADFRDPMTTDTYPGPGARRWLWRRIERFAVRHAALCVFTTSSAAEAYAARYPEARARMAVVENGYDESAFREASPMRPGLDDDALLLLHSGGIYPKDRDPTAFFIAIQRLVAQGTVDRGRLCLRFRASGHDSYVRELAERHGVADIVDIAPPVPYRQAIGEMMGADLLLLFQGKQFNTQIPAKVYEYLRAGRPLMGLVDHAGQTARVLAGYGATSVVDIGDVDEILAGLQQWLATRASAEVTGMLASNAERVRANSRESQAATLAGHLNAITKAA